MRFAHAWSRALVGAALLGVVAVALSPAMAAVYSARQALAAQVIQQFLANPAALLAQYPEGGAELISRVRDLSASDPATLQPLIGLLVRANPSQSSAIGTGLGQTALMAVKLDQAYANEIQEAIASAYQTRGAAPAAAGGAAPAQPKIANAVVIKDEVTGLTEKGTQTIAAGSEVYENELVRTSAAGEAELLFADRTNVTLAPMTEIRLGKFVYDPTGGSGTLAVEARAGSFRFITGVQPSKDYTVRTPVATITVHGTTFLVVITPNNGVQIELLSGALTVTTISGTTIDLTIPSSVLTVDANGQVAGPTLPTRPIVDFADLGPPITDLTLADALSAFSAVTGNVAIAAAGGGGGGEGGGTGGGGTGGVSVTAFGGIISGGVPSLSTFVVTTPSNFFNLSFTASGSTPGTTVTTTTTTTSPRSVSPH